MVTKTTNKGTRKEYKQTQRHLPKDRQQQDTHVSKSAQMRRQARDKRKRERIQSRKPRRRIFPIWLRLIVVLLLSVAALVAGLMIGYGVVGEGVPTDVLKVETWQHIIDIVKKKE